MRMIWAARRWMVRFGWQGSVGMLLTLASAALYIFAVRPAQTEFADAAATVSSLEQHARGDAGRPPRPLTTNEKLDAFYQFFPEATSTPQLLDKIFAAALDQEVGLEQGEYRLTLDRESRLARYQITLPLKAPYLRIRGFVEEVLQQVPAIALDDISFKREIITATAVEAQIKFTLYLRGF